MPGGEQRVGSCGSALKRMSARSGPPVAASGCFDAFRCDGGNGKRLLLGELVVASRTRTIIDLVPMMMEIFGSPA